VSHEPGVVGRKGRVVEAPVEEVVVRGVPIPVRDGQVDRYLRRTTNHELSLTIAHARMHARTHARTHTRHTAHGTRHTAHGTRHTAHGTRHTAHGTRHTAHGTRHTNHRTCNDSQLVYLHPVPLRFVVAVHGRLALARVRVQRDQVAHEDQEAEGRQQCHATARLHEPVERLQVAHIVVAVSTGPR
jgi:hypothetical protein